MRKINTLLKKLNKNNPAYSRIEKEINKAKEVGYIEDIMEFQSLLFEYNMYEGGVIKSANCHV